MLNKLVHIKTIIILLFILGQSFFCFSQSKIVEIVTEKSAVKFKIKHLKILNVHGEFSNYSGEFIIVNNKLEQANFNILVQSIDTKSSQRDQIIQEEKYLNVINFPNIYFISNEITTKFINGFLKIKGVEKAIKIPYKWIKSENKITIKTSINRKNFKLDFGSMNGLIGNKIEITLELFLTEKQTKVD